MGVPDIYTVGPREGTDHASPYTYDTHVPLAFYGLPFQPGTYRQTSNRSIWPPHSHRCWGSMLPPMPLDAY